MRLYTGLASEKASTEEGLALCGFTLGNGEHKGCLTTDARTRLHTCERGIACDTLKSEEVVYITPVVARTSDGIEVLEQGATIGTGDLDPAHELDMSDPEIITTLLQLGSELLDEHSLSKLASLIADVTSSGRNVISIPSADFPEIPESLSPKQILEVIIGAGKRRQDDAKAQNLDEQRGLTEGAGKLKLPRKLVCSLPTLHAIN